MLVLVFVLVVLVLVVVFVLVVVLVVVVAVVSLVLLLMLILSMFSNHRILIRGHKTAGHAPIHMEGKNKMHRGRIGDKQTE